MKYYVDDTKDTFQNFSNIFFYFIIQRYDFVIRQKSQNDFPSDTIIRLTF